MAKQIINVGTTANDKKGDSLRTAFQKVNANFNELYATLDPVSLTELAQDYAASMFTNGTHTGIVVEYDDVGNVINLTALGQTSSGATPPTDPAEGALWYDATDGRLYVYYDGFWVDASPESVYSLPTASDTTLGGVKIGANLSINGDGVLSAVDSYVLPTATDTILGGIKVGANLSINGDGVLSAPAPTDLGDLEISGQTISGTVTNSDIVLDPAGTGSVSVPSLKIPVGTILGGTAPIIYTLTDVILDSILEYSTSPTDTLEVGDYGITNGIPAPYAVYQFTADPTPALQVNDILAGVGIPNAPDASVVLAVGTGIYSNVVIAYSDYSTIPVPISGTVITVARATTNANMFLDTEALTDIALSPGPGGNIVARSNILPFTTDVYDLGSPAKRFRRLWLGAGTIYVQDETLGTDQAIGARDGDLYIAGGAGLKVGEFTFDDNNIFINDSSRDINIGTVGATGNINFRRKIHVRNSDDTYDLFSIDPEGRVDILSDITEDPTESAVSIIGSSSRTVVPPNNTGVLLHLTGSSTTPSRIYHDSYGAANYSAFIGRKARGSSQSPSQVLANDIITRLGANPYKTSAFSDISTMRMDFVATEDQTDSAQGNEIQLWTTAVGETIIRERLSVDSTGIVLTALGGGGITFADSTRQTTAWTGSVSTDDITGLSLVATTNNYNDLTNLPALFSGDYNDLSNKPNPVLSIAVTSGLTVGRVNGAVTLGNSGVLSVAAASGTGQIGVTTVGGAVTLTLPQAIATTSNVTFNDLTINGTLTVENFELSTAPTIAGKLLYLAADALNGDDVNGGGIQLGPVGETFSRSFLYDLTNDRWDTDGSGLITEELFSQTIKVQERAYFGNAYQGIDFPGADVQVDANRNDVSQVLVQNHNDGASAMSMFVALNDVGVGVNHSLAAGIVSSNFTNMAFPAVNPNDGFLNMSGGDLLITTLTAGDVVKFYTGGMDLNDLRATISDTGLAVVGTVSATAFSGPLTGNVTGNVSGNAGTVTNGVYTTDTGTVTNTMLAGSIANNKLLNSSVTVNGTTISLGGSGTVTAAASTLTGTTLASNVLTSSLTSVGTLTNLTVTNPITGSVTGNAGTVTNGVYTTGSYNNPSWIIGLAYSKLTGAPTALSAFTNDSGYITSSSLSVTSNTPSGATSTLSYNNGVFTFTSAAAYVLPTAGTGSGGTLGGVKVDGTTVTINGNGVISAATSGGTVTNVSALTIGTTGTDITSTVANSTSTPVITLNIPTASATNRGALSAADWTTFNNKGTVSSVSGTGTVSGLTLTGTVTGTGNLTLGGSLSLTSLQITTGLGYTPYNATNPAGYTTNTGTVTSVAALTIGTTGTDITSTVANGTTTPVITLNIPTASATNRGVLSSADWTTFNNKGNGTVTSVGGTGTVSGLTLTGSVTGAGNLTLGGSISGLTTSNLSATAGITNSQLANSAITINGSAISLGGSVSVGTVTSVSGTGTVSGLTLTGTVTGTGNLTLGGSLTLTSNQVTTALGYTPLQTAVTSLAGGTNIVLSGSTGNVTIQRVDGCQSVVTGNSSSNYNVLTTDQYVGTTRSLTGTGTITLPLGSTVSVGRQYIIKDEGGLSGSSLRRITVVASGSDTIDGSGTRSITSNYGSLTVLWTGTRWSVI